MVKLLELCGYAPYHAACVAPVLWGLVVSAAVYCVLGVLDNGKL